MKIQELSENFYEKIEDIKSIPYRIKKFFLKIYKILRYLPLLWKDEDWDYEYLLDLIEFKIKRMSKCIVDEKLLAQSSLDEISESIQKAVRHLDNYRNSTEAYEREHGKLPFEVCYKHVSSPENPNLYRNVSYNKSTNKELTDKEDQQYVEHIKAIYEYEQNEWNAFFDTIKEHGQSWWD